MRKKRLLCVAAVVLLLVSLLPVPAHADSVTDTIGIYVGYYGWPEEDYKEKVTYHWTELDDWVGGALDTRETVYSYYSGSRTYLVAARGFSIRDLLYYAGIDFWSIASIDFFTKDHANGAYRSFSRYSLLDMPRYYFPNLAANEETGEIYAWDGDDIWNGATTVESMLALEDYTEWDTVGSEFEQRYDPALLSPNCRFHLFFGQADPSEASTSSAAKYCYKILITFAGTPVLSTEETDMTMKIGSGRKIELNVDAEDGLLNDYVREHISWASSDESVVSVAPDGTISVLAEGQAVVTASFGQSSVSVTVTVGGDEPSEGGGTSGEAGTGASAGVPDTPTAPDNPPAPVELPPQTAPIIETPPPAEETPEPTPGPTPEPGIELPPPTAPPEPEPELVSAQQIFTISPEVLAGLLKTSPDAAAESGGRMEPDSAQLVLTPPEHPDRTLWIAGIALGAFTLGAAYELLRYRRLKRGKL